MSEQGDETEKTHEPTPRRIQKAREKGDVPKSQDLHAAVSYLGLHLGMSWLAGGGLLVALSAFSVTFDQAVALSDLHFSSNPSTVPLLLSEGLLPVIAILFSLPLLFVLGSAFAQRSVTFSPQKLQPKLERISPISIAKQKFGMSGLFEFLKSFLKLTIFSICLSIFLYRNMGMLVQTTRLPVEHSMTLLFDLIFDFMIIIIAVSLVIGAVDFLFQTYSHNKKLRMSRKEIQDEMKETEGDPHQKSKRRQRAQEISSSIDMTKVAQADVVITNPTHYAIALSWSRKKGEAPVCVGKGTDEIARRIRELAMEHAVPIHEDPPTARALHATTDIGEEIPPDLYRAVATAIRFAEAMRSRASRSFR